MTLPRLINCLPSFGNAAGGESVTIAGLDIDPAATVDFIPYPGWPSGTPIPAVVTNYINFPNGIQHITVTTPLIPPQSGIPGDLTYIDRHVTLRVTNPPYGEYDDLEQGWDARFIDTTPTFVEKGTVVFFPERMTDALPGGPYFDIYEEGSNLWRNLFICTADGTGAVEYKQINPVAPFTRVHHEFGPQTFGGKYKFRGKIAKVQLSADTGTTAGWNVSWFDEMNVDAFQGAGAAVGPAPGGTYEFVPLLGGQPVVVDNEMRLSISGAGAAGKPQVCIWLALTM